MSYSRGDEDDRFIDRFQDLFETDDLQPMFPRNGEEPFQGTYTFLITLGDASAEIQCSGVDTMEDLHVAIQQAYGFWDGHLYSFFMTGKAWTEPSLSSSEEGPSEQSADQILIGETGLKQVDTILYLYDYGEEWRIQIKVKEMIEGA
ncbi:plasmid pRiA4b ORF-3 family protein [Halobacillus halophilus]|uniref:plasmid pRiA4b ORF-3 family protein n=1 Tax=Halobacillus halophilus TaxID=1570 RepID=UPI001CD47CDD|nr:plasmid pRiA4b ORF-3 family protein [Halobacillus halophilus]MCA1010701.1 plasmid pRiA4b ORF-3 family protein [Halobacillus halophilus]